MTLEELTVELEKKTVDWYNANEEQRKAEVRASDLQSEIVFLKQTIRSKLGLSGPQPVEDIVDDIDSGARIFVKNKHGIHEFAKNDDGSWYGIHHKTYHSKLE